jgi:hypothetical protein
MTFFLMACDPPRGLSVPRGPLKMPGMVCDEPTNELPFLGMIFNHRLAGIHYLTTFETVSYWRARSSTGEAAHSLGTKG